MKKKITSADLKVNLEKITGELQISLPHEQTRDHCYTDVYCDSNISCRSTCETCASCAVCETSGACHTEQACNQSDDNATMCISVIVCNETEKMCDTKNTCDPSQSQGQVCCELTRENGCQDTVDNCATGYCASKDYCLETEKNCHSNQCPDTFVCPIVETRTPECVISANGNATCYGNATCRCLISVINAVNCPGIRTEE